MQAFWQSYAVALIVVGLMLYGLHALARVIARGRLRSQVDTRLIAVVTSSYVSQNTTVSVVKAGSRYLLIGGGNGHLQTLCELPADEVARWLTDRRSL
jgi:flagellar biogenesis protein FliO